MDLVHLQRRTLPTRQDLAVTATGKRRRLARLLRVLIYVALLMPITLSLLALAVLGPSGMREAANDAGVTAQDLWLNSGLQLVGFALLPLLFVWVAQPGTSPLERLGLAPGRSVPAFSIMGAGLGCALLFLLLLLGPWLSALEEPTRIELDMAQAVREQPWLVLVMPLVAGFSEEILFRGFLQPRFGIIPTSLVFGLAHMAYGSLTHMAVATVAGLFLGGLYRITGLLWTCVAAHFTYDLVALLLMYRG